MVAFTTEIQTLLAAITSISLYCEQLKLGPTCTILTKYYQPNKNVMNVYGILPPGMNFTNNGINGALLSTFKTDTNLQLYFPDFQYFNGQKKPLLHTFERSTRKVINRNRTIYSIFTYSNDVPKISQGEFQPIGNVTYEFCFSNMNQFYCIFYNKKDKEFHLSRKIDNSYVAVNIFTNDEGKITLYSFDYCTSSLIFVDENDMYFMHLYNLVGDLTQSTKIPKSEQKISFCHQADGRLKATPMFLTTFANSTDLLQSESHEIGLIDFEVCNITVKKGQNLSCPAGIITKKEKEEKGFFENSGNLIWTIVCGIGLFADIIMVVITVIYYIKKRNPKKVVREVGTETYMGITASQSPTTQKKSKGKVPPPPPKQLEMTTPTIGQSQESAKPQSTLLITDF